MSTKTVVVHGAIEPAPRPAATCASRLAASTRLDSYARYRRWVDERRAAWPDPAPRPAR